MSDDFRAADNCDDQAPTFSSLGHDNVCEKPLQSRVGSAAVPSIHTYSTIGKGPKGDPGVPGVPGPPGADGGTLTTEELDAMMDARIVVIPYDQWPPLSPVNGVLYLRAAE